MSKYKHRLPGLPAEHEASKTTWTYWLSRDSIDGAKCSLWYEKPLRTKIGSRVTWCSEYGHLGNFRPDEILSWRSFLTFPETDMELLRIETRPSAKELEEAQRKAKFT